MQVPLQLPGTLEVQAPRPEMEYIERTSKHLSLSATAIEQAEILGKSSSTEESMSFVSVIIRQAEIE